MSIVFVQRLKKSTLRLEGPLNELHFAPVELVTGYDSEDDSYEYSSGALRYVRHGGDVVKEVS
jgi:hypothetical protein